MKKLYLLSFLLFFNYSFSQSTSVLDERNGFQSFKFGDNLEKWKSQLSRADVVAPNAYDYNGSCCKSILDFDVTGIRLRFENNKLVEIAIFIKEDYYSELPSDKYLKYYENAFTSSFGRYTYGGQYNSNENNFEVMEYQWQGEKVLMQLLTFYGPYKNGSMKAIVRLYDKKNYLKNNIKNF